MNNKLWQSLANSWKIPELRAKVLFTAGLILIYRFGCHVPVPGVDVEAIQSLGKGSAGGVFNLMNLFSGGALLKVAVFALGIMPYITASIIMQLMTVVIPKLEALSKEGEQGQKEITKYTRWLTVCLAAVQALGYVFLFRDLGAFPKGLTPSLALIVIVTLTAGAAAVMWMGELITARGIGNGMSIMIFISIISRLPAGLAQMTTMNVFEQVGIVVVAVAMIVAVIWITTGERRIPVQYAKRVVGRKMMGGASTYIPLKVNMAGVIPVIFATSVMMIPSAFASLAGRNVAMTWITGTFGPNRIWYLFGEVFFIVVFTYFYTAVTFNPIDQADNLKKYGGFVPGVRPGLPTAEFLDRILTRLTLPGALFLAAVVVVPWVLTQLMNVPFYLGGTSLLIVVGVALDTMRQMEAQLLMRNYEGFLK